jgi:hypothetical protein
MMGTDIWVARAAACAVIVLSLAGCSAPAAEAPAAEVSTEGSSEVVEYPVGFPTDEVPMFAGTLLHVGHPGNLWAAWISSDDLVADLATASQQLVDAGYTQTVAADGFAEFTNPQRSLRIVASVDGTYGSCLAYTFTDGAGEPEDAAEQDAAPAEH